MRPDLIERTRGTLARAGFAVSEPTQARPVSFDIVGRRGEDLFLVKVFTNADSLSEPLAEELRTLAGILRAAPLLVGERSSAGPLEDGVLYFRHKVPLITPGTLERQLLHDEPPLVYAAPGGYYVDLDGATLRALRESRQMSLGQVAEVAGVSRRAVAMYEEGMGALVEVAERLEEFFREPLIRPMELFATPEKGEPPAFDPARVRERLEREVLQHLHSLGYRIILTERSLFDALSQDGARRDNLILTGVGELQPDLAGRARALQSIASVVEREVVIFVRDRKTREHLEGTAVIAWEELARMDDTGQVRDLIRQRAPPPGERAGAT